MTDPTRSCCGADLEGLLDPEFFRSLADPVRLQVVVRLCLAERPQTVSELQDCCDVHLSGVSRHLRQLREAGVAQAQKSGREVRYSLRREPLASYLRSLADAIEGTGPASKPCP